MHPHLRSLRDRLWSLVQRRAVLIEQEQSTEAIDEEIQGVAAAMERQGMLPLDVQLEWMEAEQNAGRLREALYGDPLEENRTPWVDRILTKYHDAVLSVAPPGYEPEIEEATKKRLTFAELGCGHYGCVIPVQASGQVFKLTTDPAEAAFVRAAIEIGEFPAGIVRYTALYALKGATFRKRQVFALWRQEADDIGFLNEAGRSRGWGVKQRDAYERRVAKQGINLVMNAQQGAAALRDWLKKGKPVAGVLDRSDSAWRIARQHADLYERTSPFAWDYPRNELNVRKVVGRYRGAERAAVGLAIYEVCAELMEYNNAMVSTVGNAMNFYLRHKIVMADVHLNNIGKTEHEDYSGEVVSITDPGHAVFLTDEYDGLDIEELSP